MRPYSSHGFNEFVILEGYKQHVIKYLQKKVKGKVKISSNFHNVEMGITRTQLKRKIFSVA